MKKCENCTTELKLRKGYNKRFCSLECYWNSKTRKTEYLCSDCGGQKSAKKSLRCKDCSTEYRRSSRHHGWVGNKVGYRALHNWIERLLGKPCKCTNCGLKATGHRMHWANKSGLYKRDPQDWVRLCSQCHGAFDSGRLLIN